MQARGVDRTVAPALVSYTEQAKDCDFEALGVAKFSAAFDEARLTAPALVELVEGSPRADMDDVIAFLHMEVEVDIRSCEWIYEQVVASRRQPTARTER